MSEDREAKAQERRIIRMNAIDALPYEFRELVHEYGFTIVYSFLVLKVNEARHIRHLVETVLDEFSPSRGSSSFQGPTRGHQQ